MLLVLIAIVPALPLNVPAPEAVKETPVAALTLAKLSLASNAFTVTLNAVPAICGVPILGVITSFVAVPAIVVILLVTPVKPPPSVPITVRADASVFVVKTTVAIPLPSVVLVGLAKDPIVPV